MSKPKGPSSKRGLLTEMPRAFVDVVNRAVRGYLDIGLMVAKPGGGEKPALKGAIQTAILLDFARASEEKQREIIDRGLAIYAELLAGPSVPLARQKAPTVYDEALPTDSGRTPRKRRGGSR